MLKPMGLDDLDQISPWFWNVNDVAMFDRTLPLPVNADFLRESWRVALSYADPPRAYWFVAARSDGKPLGVGGLQAINYIHGDAVLPMFISDEARGMGLATAITCRMLDMAFDRLRLHRVTTFYRADNDASQHVLTKLGFSEEGRQREGWFVDGARLDIVHSGILASDWRERRAEVMDMLGSPGKVRLAFMGESNV
ncbi:MAG: GNAT family protein [Pseudomonadota bacterium]